MPALRVFIITLMLFFLTGCSSDKPFVVFSSSPITEKTQPESRFGVGTKIYYAAVAPKGFKDRVIKVQIFKKDEKSEFWGYSYRYNRTCELSNPNYYMDYVVIHEKGLYAMQVFYLSNLQQPIALDSFWVIE